jgi:hypothetical protein
VSKTDITCHGLNNGKVTGVGSGGTGAYSYVLNGVSVNTTGATTGIFTGLVAGSYTVTVTDVNGCSITSSSVTVVDPPAVVANAGSPVTICNGVTVTLGSSPTAIGGNGIYTYNWTVGGVTVSTQSNPSVSPTATTTYNLTVTDGNGCTGNSSVTITVNQVPTLSVNNTVFTICDKITPNILLGNPNNVTGTGYVWNTSTTNLNVSNQGLPAAPAGSIDTQLTLVTSNSPGSVVYTIQAEANNCYSASQTVTVNVNPIPTVQVSPSSQTICSGGTTNIAIINPNNVNGTTFGWTASATNVNGATLGSGALISQALTSATGNTQGTVTYTVMPTANGCNGSTAPVNITVNPTPTLSISGTVFTVCNNGTPNIVLNNPNNVTSTGYVWTTSVSNLNPVANQATPAIASAVNTSLSLLSGGTNQPGSVVYSVQAEATNCLSAAQTVTVTVQPVPSANGTDLTICSGSIASVTINNTPQNVSGTTFSWIVIPTSNVTGALADNGSTISQTLTLTNYSVGSVIYRITPTANGCNGPTKDITATVDPVALVNAGTDYAVCQPSTILLSGTIGGAATSATWLIVAGHGTISSSTVSGTNVTATYTVAPSDITTSLQFKLLTNDPDGTGPCNPVYGLLNVAVNKAPIVSVPANYTVCEPTAIPLTGTIGGSATTGLWSIVSGNGTLSATNVSGTTVTASYSVAPADIATTVTFRLTTNDPDGSGPCVPVHSDITITINRQARVFAPANLSQCSDTPSIVLGGSIGGSTSQTVWSGGTGAFSNTSDPNSTYSFSSSETPTTASGPITVVLTLTALDPDGPPPNGPCTSVSTQTNLHINPLPVVVFTGFPGGSPPQMAQNNAPITLTGNQIGGLFTIQPSTANIGSTTINPVDKVTFDPSAAALGVNTVKYTYTDANSCTNSSSQNVIINPVTRIDFTVQTGYLDPNFDWEICSEQNNPSLNNPSPSLIKLIGNPAAATGGSPETNFVASAGQNNASNVMNIVHNGTEYYVETRGLPPDTYLVTYTYKNSVNAITTIMHPIIVHAAPRAKINVVNNCIASAINFNDATPVNPVEPVVSWKWDFGDGAISSTQNTSHIYTIPSVYNVILQVTTSFGCSDTTLFKVRVGAVPIPFFTASSICNNDSTRFTDGTTNPNNVSRITKYIWDFGDGKILTGDSTAFGTAWNKGNVQVLPNPDSISGTYKNPFHKYRNYQTYHVKQTVLTNDGCNNSYQKTIFILPYSSISPKAGNSYFQDFETAGHGWIPESLGTPLDSSWIWTIPNGHYINSGTKSWWTGLNNGTYEPNESSVVNGPCFNLVHLTRPMIAMDFWVNTPKSNNDGAALQYSTDGGAHWFNIGVPQEGQNWYSGALIVSNPGKQLVGPFGWSGNTQTKWVRASFSLDSIPKPKRKQVRIRVAFAGDVTKNIDDTYNGFAFDNVFVGEKTKTVLIEHFTNASVKSSLDGDNYFNGLYDYQVKWRHDSSDFYDIQYHVRFPKPDDLDQVDVNDPSARALFYGIQQAPYSIMDGIQSGKFQLGAPRTILLTDIDSSALRPPLVNIVKIDTTSQNAYTNHTISLNLNGVANATFSGQLLAQVALIEDPVVVNDTTFRNVVRKLFFGSEGIKAVTLNKGDAFSFTKQDIEVATQIQNPTKLHLVAFIQNYITKEVLQSFKMPLNNKRSQFITAIENPAKTIASIEDVRIYPNPANGKFNFGLPGDFPANCIWKIADQRGVNVMGGDFNDAVNGTKSVDISSIPNGVYFVAIGAPGVNPVYRKLVVLNSN